MFLRVISSFFDLIQEKKPKFHDVWNLGFCGGRLLPTTPSSPFACNQRAKGSSVLIFFFSLSILVRLSVSPFKSAASRLLKGAKHNTEGIVIAALAIVVVEVEHPSNSAIVETAPAFHPRVRRVDRITIILVPSILAS